MSVLYVERLVLMLVGAAAFCAPPILSYAAERCIVLDPELKGSYQGGCKDGLADGPGKATGAGYYEGHLRGGAKHGIGVKVMPNGDRYEGEFKEDRRHGKGTYVWGPKSPWAGDRYRGEYRDDKRDGIGVYLWANGDRYEGPWKNDQRLGLSVMETRRLLAQQELEKAIPVGEKVCGERREGIATMERVSGIVQEIGGGVVRVRVLDAGVVSGHKAGEVVVDQVVNWVPCG